MNVGGHSGAKGERSGDFDLNLAPVIDCLTVLIAFVLASASFLAVGMLSTSVAVNGPAAPSNDNTPPPSIRLDVELTTKNEINVKVTGKAKMEKLLPPKDGEWDRAALLSEIGSIKKQWPDTKSAVLSAQDDVEYIHVVKVMDSMRSKLSSILLGGL